jgi:hypothetical protein
MAVEVSAGDQRRRQATVQISVHPGNVQQHEILVRRSRPRTASIAKKPCKISETLQFRPAARACAGSDMAREGEPNRTVRPVIPPLEWRSSSKGSITLVNQAVSTASSANQSGGLATTDAGYFCPAEG